MKKRLLDNKILGAIISVIIALIILIIGCSLLKHTHVDAKTDVKTSIIFVISLFASCIAYLWIIVMSIGIIETIEAQKKKH